MKYLLNTARALSVLTSFYLILFLNEVVFCMTEVERHLEEGKQLLATGQLGDALTHFHSAIDADPSNYMAFYRRGTVFLAMGKFKSASSDLSRVLELKPDFNSARMQYANIFLKRGNFDEAIKNYEEILKHDQYNSEAQLRSDKAESIINDIINAKSLKENGQIPEAIGIFNEVLESCPWSTEVHELRSECFLSIGETGKAILDIHALSKLIPDNTDAFYRLSQLHYSMGDADLALNDIRECLRLDQDHKKCMDYYKMLKKLNKLIDKMKKSHDEENFDQCVATATTIKQLDPQSLQFFLKSQSYICSCQYKDRKSVEAIESCTEYINKNPNDAETLYNRAQSYILEEDLEKAQSDCQRAHEIENSQRTTECLEKINKLIKQSKKRDYYKILGLKRSCTSKNVLKAYRKLAKKWHPDNFQDEKEKEKAQKVFIDIAAAKEVLNDPEKRHKFDNGMDPLDAEEQAESNRGHHPFGGGHPFGGHQGGNQGGHHGGGNQNFHFKFKFN